MRRFKRLVIFFVFVSSIWLPKMIVGGTSTNESSLGEATVQILRSCYGNLVTPVGLAGNSAGKIGETLWSQDDYSAVLIDVDSRIVVNGPVRPIDRFRLQVFVIAASSDGNLMRTLRRIKASIWWNHMADFLIVHWSPSGSDCSNTFDMLWTAWEMNILNANFMCDDLTKGLLIYTFNPYTSQAPDPWRYVRTYKGVKNHPWTLFVRRYEDAEEICHELDYKKTNDLGGYEIRVSVGDTVHRRRDISEGMCFDPIASDTCSIVFPAMNATIKLLQHSFADSLGHVDDEGKAYGILREVSAGESDVGINGRSYVVMRNMTTSLMYYQIHMHAVTQFNGYKSQWEKLGSVIDDESRYGLYLVILITILFFKLFVNESTISAVLNTFRIICNTVVPKLSPTTSAPRIFFTGLFLFALIMQGIYQGRLASLVTKPEPLRNVDTMKDLAELGHQVYGVPGYGIYFGDPAFEGRFHPNKGDLCTKYAQRDPKAACVAQERIITAEAAKFKLHLSRRKLATNHVALPIRPDWPLEQRLNEILMRSVSGGLKRHLNNRAMYEPRRHIRLQESVYRNDGLKKLSLEQLSFAFVILAMGLSLATISFVMELGFGRRRESIARTKIRNKKKGGKVM